ncbi:MAG TPA: ABC transporter substrate-binding protein [Stellaceae bacterium]|nr:ABC transporter substrate-binding protein [Stellaceae bacterium]
MNAVISRILVIFAGVALGAAAAHAENAPGITATRILIGQNMPYSGVVSAYSILGKGHLAFIHWYNDTHGGVNGRKIDLESMDDGYNPAKSLENVRKMVEQDHVAFIFGSIGTATNTAVRKYLNDKGVPQLFLASGADKWGDYQHYPWTMSWQATFRTEARIYAKYILAHKPDAKIAVLYQHDDFGKDYVTGVKDVLGDRFGQRVVTATYEVSDPTVDSQVLELQASGATALIFAGTPKFAAQTIRKVYDIGWKPMFFMDNVSIATDSVMGPAGPEKSIGMLSSAYSKDPGDPAWAKDPGTELYRGIVRKYVPSANGNDFNYENSWGMVLTLVQVLKQCGNDLSRQNIMRQAANLHDLELPSLLPGIKLNTSPTDYQPMKQMQLQRWDGKSWVRFGDLITGGGS